MGSWVLTHSQKVLGNRGGMRAPPAQKKKHRSQLGLQEPPQCPLPPSSTPAMERGETAPKLCQKKKKKTLSQLCPGINPERLRVASTGGLSNALKVVRGGINPCGEADGEALPF